MGKRETSYHTSGWNICHITENMSLYGWHFKSGKWRSKRTCDSLHGKSIMYMIGNVFVWRYGISSWYRTVYDMRLLNEDRQRVEFLEALLFNQDEQNHN